MTPVWSSFDDAEEDDASNCSCGIEDVIRHIQAQGVSRTTASQRVGDFFPSPGWPSNQLIFIALTNDSGRMVNTSSTSYSRNPKTNFCPGECATWSLILSPKKLFSPVVSFFGKPNRSHWQGFPKELCIALTSFSTFHSHSHPPYSSIFQIAVLFPTSVYRYKSWTECLLPGQVIRW